MGQITHEDLNVKLSEEIKESTRLSKSNEGKIEQLESLPSEFEGHVEKIASDTELGHIKVDGTSIKINGEGVISAEIPVIQDATTTQKGIVQLTNDITGQSESLALTQKGANLLHESITTVVEKLVEHNGGKASGTELGHVQVGEGLVVSNGIVSLERTTNSNFEIDTPPSQYPLGVTEIPIQTINDSKYYSDLRIILNTLLGFHQGEGLYYRYYVKITKKSNSSVRQEVFVTSNIVGSEGYEMFKLERETNFSNSTYYPWRTSVNTMVGRGEPENIIPAMRGCLYFDCRGGKLYRKNTGISDAPSTGWSIISS